MKKIIVKKINNSCLQTFINNKSISGDSRESCFFMANGECPDFEHYIDELDKSLETLEKTGTVKYWRFTGLPSFDSGKDTAIYNGMYDNFNQSVPIDFNKLKCEATRALSIKNHFSLSLRQVISVYEKIKLSSSTRIFSESMKKNFVIKLLFWADECLTKVFEDNTFDDKKEIKLVFSDISKEQEILCCYLFALLGCDVLILNNDGKINVHSDNNTNTGKATNASQVSYVSKVIEDLISVFTIGENGNTKIKAYKKNDIKKNTAPAAETANEADGPVRMVIPGHPGRTTKKSAQSDTQAVNSSTSSSDISSPGYVPTLSASAIKRPSSSRAGISVSTASHRSSATTTGRTQTKIDNVEPDTEKSYEELARLASSIVMIAIIDKEGEPCGTGSGIMIGQGGYILTNFHVVSGGALFIVRIEDDDKNYVSDQVIKYNPDMDLAIIRIEKELKPLKIYKGSKELVRGQKVVAIGSPLGLFNSVSDGIISGFRRIRDNDMIQFTAPTSHGSSGGAVLNMRGEVIGISTAGIDDGQNINLAVGYKDINMFVRGFV